MVILLIVFTVLPPTEIVNVSVKELERLVIGILILFPKVKLDIVPKELALGIVSNVTLLLPLDVFPDNDVPLGPVTLPDIVTLFVPSSLCETVAVTVAICTQLEETDTELEKLIFVCVLPTLT